VTLGPEGVELGGVADPPVRLRPHTDPALAREELAAVRAFVAAADREGARRAGASRPAAGPPPPAGGLSGREVEVARLIAWGYSHKEVAARMGLSVKSVETYEARALEKLGLHSRVDLVRYAFRQGWLDAAAGG
jgi:DNA-binding NarL/FixJ family response regulator